jgi:hypothetical protein
MPNTYTIAIPFNLTPEELILEAHGEEQSVLDQLHWLKATSHPGLDGELDRVLTCTVLLRAANPDASLEDCVRTAIVWERG